MYIVQICRSKGNQGEKETFTKEEALLQVAFSWRITVGGSRTLTFRASLKHLSSSELFIIILCHTRLALQVSCPLRTGSSSYFIGSGYGVFKSDYSRAIKILQQWYKQFKY